MSDTTNDEQAEEALANSIEMKDGVPVWKEGVIKTATAPLMSDEELTAITKRYPEVNGDTGTAYDAGDEIRDWYEAKIASGELAVVKTVKRSDIAAHMHEHEVRGVDPYTWIAPGAQARAPRCIVCGAKIIEA